MPTPEEILAGLTQIANQWRALAIAWHVYFAVLGLGLVFGLRPTKMVAGVLLGLPLLSVSALAWLQANPFNGTAFALAGITLIALSIRLPRERTWIAPAWAVIAGTLMFAFGWIYPHFLDTGTWLLYLYSAPTGLVPCPTLSIVIGVALILGGLGSRAWSLILAATGMFYGVFGAARLGVAIDSVLLIGSVLLVLVALRPASVRVSWQVR